METDSGAMTINIGIIFDPEKLHTVPIELYDENTIFAKHNARNMPAENVSDECPLGNDLRASSMRCAVDPVHMVDCGGSYVLHSVAKNGLGRPTMTLSVFVAHSVRKFVCVNPDTNASIGTARRSAMK